MKILFASQQTNDIASIIRAAYEKHIEVLVPVTIERISTLHGAPFQTELVIFLDHSEEDDQWRIVTEVSGNNNADVQKMLFGVSMEPAVFNINREGIDKYSAEMGIFLAYDRWVMSEMELGTKMDTERIINKKLDADVGVTVGKLHHLGLHYTQHTGEKLGDFIRKSVEDVCKGNSKEDHDKHPESQETPSDTLDDTSGDALSAEEGTGGDAGELGSRADSPQEEAESTEDGNVVADNQVGDSADSATSIGVSHPYESAFMTLGKALGYENRDVRDADYNIVSIQFDEAFYKLYVLHNHMRTELMENDGTAYTQIPSVAEMNELWTAFCEAHPEIQFIYDTDIAH